MKMMKKRLLILLLLMAYGLLLTADSPAQSKMKFFYPTKAFSDGKRLYVVDSFNHRVLVYGSIEPIENIEPAAVIGQADSVRMVPNFEGVSAKSLCAPNSATSDGHVLAVVDTGNHRVLIYNSIPTGNYQPADVVLGQPDFASNLPNNGGVSARSLYYPRDAYYDGKRLFVSDTFNNRVLIYNSLPTENFKPADLVLGQADFSGNEPNAGGVSERGLYFPTGLYSNGERLFVTDQFNNRVKAYNRIPSENNAPCDLVLGQPDFRKNEPNQGSLAPNASSMNNPTSIHFDGKALYIADYGNNRILVYDKFPTQIGEEATSVVGQADFTSR